MSQIFCGQGRACCQHSECVLVVSQPELEKREICWWTVASDDALVEGRNLVGHAPVNLQCTELGTVIL